jgi:hypothetical protein
MDEVRVTAAYPPPRRISEAGAAISTLGAPILNQDSDLAFLDHLLESV